MKDSAILSNDGIYTIFEWGGCLIKIDKCYPSSQIGSGCGLIHPKMKDLSVRRMKCACGIDLDCDYNAAKNIKKEGLRMLIA